MLRWAHKKLREMTLEEWCITIFGASFFVGVWYAFPMVNTITDVWPFGGGVLRAMEAHTLLPGGDVAYGTLSFYQNYVAMAIALCIGYVASGFDLEAVKTALILNPSYSLLVPRIVSALTAVAFLVIVYRFLKAHVQSAHWRLALLVLAFGNVLAMLLARSGKMWILSTALCIVSFIYLYRSVTEEAPSLPGRFAAISIVTAFLATANFAFAAVFLINIPILLFVFPRTYACWRRLVYAIAAGTGAFLLFFVLNAGNVISQVWDFIPQLLGTPAGSVINGRPALTLLESFTVSARHAVEAFPLLLLALIPALRSGLRDRPLAYLALIYIAVYVVAVSVVFRVDHGLALNVRHIFPIGFFLMFLLAAYKSPRRFVAISFCTAGLVLYLYTLVLLSIPTTYNATSDFIVERYGDAEIRIDESVFELTLPTNRAAYALYATSSCGSTCQHVRTLATDIPFRPLIVTKDSDPTAVAQLPPSDLIVVERAIEACTPVMSFGSGVRDEEVFDIDINLGRMLLRSFYELHRLGKNIYIYESKECAETAPKIW